MPYEQLILEKFTAGMYDYDELSRLQYPAGACSDCDNIIFTPAGAITKRPGYEQLSSERVANAAVIKMYQWQTTAGAQYAFAFTCASGTTSATLKSIVTSGATTVYENIALPENGLYWNPGLIDGVSCASWAGSAIFTYNNIDQYMIAFDGTSTSAVAVTGGTGTPSGAKVVGSWGNYLFAGNVLVGGVRKGSRLQWTYPGDIDNWPAASYIDLDSDDGDEITGIVNFKNVLYVFKRYKMWRLWWVGGNLLFQEERVAHDVGMIGPNAWITDGDTLYFIGDYTAYEYNGTGYPASISDNIQTSWNLMNLSTWAEIGSKHGWEFEVESDPEHWSIWFHIPHLTSNYKNRVYVYDTRFKSWSKFSLTASALAAILYGKNTTYGDLIAAYTTYGTKRIQDYVSENQSLFVLGDYSGLVHQYGGSSNDNGTAIRAYWTSPWMDMGKSDLNKRFYRATAIVEKFGNYDLDVYFYKDWNETTAAFSKTISLSGGLDTLMLEKRLDFTTHFRALQLKIGIDEVDTSFILYKFIINYLLKGQTLVA